MDHYQNFASDDDSDLGSDYGVDIEVDIEFDGEELGMDDEDHLELSPAMQAEVSIELDLDNLSPSPQVPACEPSACSNAGAVRERG